MTSVSPTSPHGRLPIRGRSYTPVKSIASVPFPQSPRSPISPTQPQTTAPLSVNTKTAAHPFANPDFAVHTESPTQASFVSTTLQMSVTTELINSLPLSDFNDLGNP